MDFEQFFTFHSNNMANLNLPVVFDQFRRENMVAFDRFHRDIMETLALSVDYNHYVNLIDLRLLFILMRQCETPNLIQLLPNELIFMIYDTYRNLYFEADRIRQNHDHE